MSEPVIIIAEAGVNHNGDLVTALRLIDAAKNAGADYVKFQTFKADSLVASYAKKASYQMATTDVEETQFDMLKKLELTDQMHHALKQHCDVVGIGFLSSPFDIESIHYLKSFGMDYIKIPSGEITNLPFLRAVNDTGMPVILSTGMSTLDEVQEAVSALKDCQKKYILHCNTEYPTPMKDVNLRAMNTMSEYFPCPVGYSDHTLGIEVPIAAVAMGARMIEKHLTLDRDMIGPDHRASLEPEMFLAMVTAIRNIELALGVKEKQPSESEIKNRPIARKSIVASCKISSGEMLSAENMTVKRPGMGMSPMLWDSVVGQRAKQDFQKDELIVL